ncbi:MAG: C45 family autoproteolytic acyltransferase/hydrolase [Actinomycetota bacterium]|nr:C45 family autoproteolytic acyltransferase/hydrolase [Actinomycetota bacterium]
MPGVATGRGVGGEPRDGIVGGEPREGIVAGGPDDYLEVRHVVVRGTNRQIGEELALLARDRHGVVPARGGEPLVTRARRRWYQREWPAHYERMRGVADVHGVDVHDDTVELGLLPWLGSPAVGCSVAWLPPAVTATGHPTHSRNYDFPTGTLTEILGGEAQPGELPMTARPYVVETRPTNGGPACLFVCAYELLGGCIDGVNEEGLVVALLADDESGSGDATLAPAVGLNEIQLLRFVLETCVDTCEAREALLSAKQHFMFLPCHFLVADARGDSFVWERTGSREYVVDGGGGVQVVTNHLLHGRPSLADLPPDDGPSATYARARRLTEAVTARTAPLSTGDIEAAHACVHREDPGSPTRTLWHGIYDAADRTLDVSFYLGDAPDGGVRRSPYLSFGL